MISVSKAEHLPSFLKQRPGGTWKWPIGFPNTYPLDKLVIYSLDIGNSSI